MSPDDIRPWFKCALEVGFMSLGFATLAALVGMLLAGIWHSRPWKDDA